MVLIGPAIFGVSIVREKLWKFLRVMITCNCDYWITSQAIDDNFKPYIMMMEQSIEECLASGEHHIKWRPMMDVEVPELTDCVHQFEHRLLIAKHTNDVLAAQIFVLLISSDDNLIRFEPLTAPSAIVWRWS